MQTF
jgi:hypothetical protein